MTEQIVIVDCNAGNLHSLFQGFKRVIQRVELPLGVMIATKSQDIVSADRIVLPGVGAFGACMEGLGKNHEALKEAVLQHKKPFLGICVGMQMMATWGEERGKKTQGLNWIAGETRCFPNNPNPLPHMGWNVVMATCPSKKGKHNPCHPVLKRVDGKDVYFAHSYISYPEDDTQILARSYHGGWFPSAVGKDNYLGVQYHPEKSGHVGEHLLEDFCRWDGSYP